MTYLIIITILAFLALAIYKTKWSVLVLIAALPVYLIRFKVGPLPTTLLEVMIWVVFVVWFIKEIKSAGGIKKYWQSRDKRQPYPFRNEIILLIIVAYLGAAVAGFSLSALGTWRAYFFEPLLVFILVINYFKSRGGLDKIIWALIVSASAISLGALVQKFLGMMIINNSFALDNRATSFFPYPNAIGLYLAPLVLLFIGFGLKTLKQKISVMTVWKLAFILGSILLSLTAIYLAQSEGALFGIAAGLLIGGLIYNWQTRVITIALILAVGGFILTDDTGQAYFKSKIFLQDSAGQIRLEQYKETKKMALAEPSRFLTGAGLSNFQAAVAPFHQKGIFLYNGDKDWAIKLSKSHDYRQMLWLPIDNYMYPHNIFLNFWSEIGLIGLILFIWLFVKFFIIAFRIFKHQSRLEIENHYLTWGLIGAMVALIVHGLVDVPYFKNDLAVLFWILFAILGIIELHFKNHGRYGFR